jgi:DNA-binding beta-propeller fold protein YncE
MATRVRALCAIAALSTVACYSTDQGRNPPLSTSYFPIGVVVSPGRTRMYVANSDFDLQFNAGTVQAFDLEAVRCLSAEFANPNGNCEPLGFSSSEQRLDTPGRCNPIADPTHPPECTDASGTTFRGSLVAGSVAIGAFATDIVYSVRPPGQNGSGNRLFMPVRGDATLNWVDVGDDTHGPPSFELECGQGADGFCDSNHRRGGDNALENTRGCTSTTPAGTPCGLSTLPPEPFGIAVDGKGEAVLVTQQTSGSVSLFVNTWDTANDGPHLEFVLGNLPLSALALAFEPTPESVLEAPSADGRSAASAASKLPEDFLLAFGNSAEVRLVRYFPDPTRPFLEASQSAGIATNSQGFNSRGIAVDAHARTACEATCPKGVSADGTADPSRLACLRSCAALGVDVYVSNRTPSSLIIGQTPPPETAGITSALPRFVQTLPVSLGASRVVVGKVLDKAGTPVVRVFVICFDLKQIFVYDPVAKRFETVINTGRGPQAFATDVDDGTASSSASGDAGAPSGIGRYAYGYIAQFTDSYIAVVDLDQRHTQTYGQVVLNIGNPVPPRAAK